MTLTEDPRLRDHFVQWRLADKAFERAESRTERAAAMVRQLRAREGVERWCWAERRLPDGLRRRAIEEGLWGPEEAIERLRRVGFVERHDFLRANLALFPDAVLPVLLDILGAPQFGDGALWSADDSALSAVALRLARAGQAPRALDAIRAIGVHRVEALRACMPFLPRPLRRRAIADVRAWLPNQPPFVRYVSLCGLLPLLPLTRGARARAHAEIVLMRAAFEDGAWRAPGDFSARAMAAHAFADVGLFDASEAECEGLGGEDELLAVARKHPPGSGERIARMALRHARGYLPAGLGAVVAASPGLAEEAIERARQLDEPLSVVDALLRLGEALGEPRASELFHEAFQRALALDNPSSEAFSYLAAWARDQPGVLTVEERAALDAHRMAVESDALSVHAASVEERLGALLFGPNGSARLATEKGFAAMVDFAEHHATGEELTLVAEYASLSSGERRAALSQALLRGGEPLWKLPTFDTLFSQEQRRVHLRDELAAYDQPAAVQIDRTLRVAAGLVEGEHRQGILSLFLEEVRSFDGRFRLEGLCAAALLADGGRREALLNEAIEWMDESGEADEDDRVEGTATMLPMLSPERALPLAVRMLDAIAEGRVRRGVAGDRLLAIPERLWVMVPEPSRARAIDWVLKEGAEYVDWAAFQSRGLPSPLRAALEERALREAGGVAGRAEGTVVAALRNMAPDLEGRQPPTVEAERPDFASKVEIMRRFFSGGSDAALQALMPSLSESELRDVWSACASAGSWQHTLDTTDSSIFAYVASEHYLHAEAVLGLVLGLGGSSAVGDVARMLAAQKAELSSPRGAPEHPPRASVSRSRSSRPTLEAMPWGPRAVAPP